MNARSIAVLLGLAVLATEARAQVDHSTMSHDQHIAAAGRSAVSQPGQAAYGAIVEIVKALESDPSTDWSKVNLERLRQHLVDMNEVTLNSRVTQTDIPGGFEAVVTGNGRTADAIRRMARAHSSQVEGEAPYRVAVTDVAGGARVRGTAVAATDPRAVAKLRGLGFIGLLTLGDHHGPHHLMMAKGTMAH